MPQSLNLKRSARVLGLLILLTALGFLGWLSLPAGSVSPRAEAALRSNDAVQVTDADAWVFTPRDQSPTTGYIVYPGARVPPPAYAPMAQALAERGHLVTLVRPPLRLSSFNNRLAGPVIESHPEIDTWVLGGHSLGGSSALAYANEHPGRVAGVVLLASRPLGMDLSDQDLPVLALYATRDGILTPSEARAAEARLPPSTRFVPIEGGNHSNFGDYGRPRGDRAARLSREEQQARVVDHVDGFIGELKRPAG